MFTSQSLRAVIPPGELVVREHRIDPAVHALGARGTLSAANVAALAQRVHAALASDVRWLIVDLADAVLVSDEAVSALAAAARALRARKGELIVAGAAPPVAEAFAALDVAHRPAQAATVDQAMMILKMLRPKTGTTHPVQPRAKQKITSLTLPRIEPS